MEFDGTEYTPISGEEMTGREHFGGGEMEGTVFRALLDWMMCSDPWPVDSDGHGGNQQVIEKWLDEESRKKGFTDWLEAYHNHGA